MSHNLLSSPTGQVGYGHPSVSGWAIGYRIQPSANIIVTELGAFWTSTVPNWITTKRVRIYRVSDQVLIASADIVYADVGVTARYDGQTVLKTISPVTLYSGVAYVVQVNHVNTNGEGQRISGYSDVANPGTEDTGAGLITWPSSYSWYNNSSETNYAGTQSSQVQTHAYFGPTISYDTAAPYLTITGPSTASTGIPSANFTATLNGYLAGNVTVTPSDGGAGVFTPSTVVLNNANTTATFTYTPAAAGTASVALSNSAGIINPSTWNVTVTNPGALTIGALTVAANDASGITFNRPATGGGSGGYTWRLYRSPTGVFTPGAGTLVGTFSGTTYKDTSANTGRMWFYRVRVTDSSAATADTVLGSYQTSKPVMPRVPYPIVFIGDSITYGVASSVSSLSFASRLPLILNAMVPARSYSVAYNGGISGSVASEWAADTGGRLTTAKNNVTSSGAKVVVIMLGTNDTKTALGVSKASFIASMTTIKNAILSVLPVGGKIFIVDPPYIVPGASTWGEASLDKLIDFRSGLSDLSASNCIIATGNNAELFLNSLSLLNDQVHPNDAGHEMLAAYVANQILSSERALGSESSVCYIS